MHETDGALSNSRALRSHRHRTEGVVGPSLAFTELRGRAQEQTNKNPVAVLVLPKSDHKNKPTRSSVSGRTNAGRKFIGPSWASPPSSYWGSEARRPGKCLRQTGANKTLCWAEGVWEVDPWSRPRATGVPNLSVCPCAGLWPEKRHETKMLQSLDDSLWRFCARCYRTSALKWNEANEE